MLSYYSKDQIIGSPLSSLSDRTLTVSRSWFLWFYPILTKIGTNQVRATSSGAKSNKWFPIFFPFYYKLAPQCNFNEGVNVNTRIKTDTQCFCMCFSKTDMQAWHLKSKLNAQFIKLFQENTLKIPLLKWHEDLYGWFSLSWSISVFLFCFRPQACPVIKPSWVFIDETKLMFQ